MKTMQFGLNLSPSAAPGADPIAAAQRAEALGFDFVSVSDHLHGRQPTFETWTLLSWLAAHTTRVGIATRVLAVPYRNPAVTAKMAETLDRLSGGRLVLGLGGGYADEEFHAFGLGVPSPRDKVDGLQDAIHIIRGLWSQPSFTYRGRLHRTSAADLEPKPARRIPIWLGTYGSRALALTGRVADGWIPSLGFAAPDRVVVLRERVMAAARAAGRDPDEITCAYNLQVRVDERAAADPLVVSGPPGEVVERLAGFVELGFDAFSFLPVGPDEHEQAERLAREVLPALRTAS